MSLNKLSQRRANQALKRRTTSLNGNKLIIQPFEKNKKIQENKVTSKVGKDFSLGKQYPRG